MKRVLLSWSSGKDCAWALHRLRQMPEVEVVALLTTFNEEAGRVSMHAVRRELVERQAAAAGLPLWRVPLPAPCPNEVYEARMADVCLRARAEQIDAVAFGDLFLEDVREYRERQLAPTGLEAMFPLWGLETRGLAREMMAGGLRATLTCVDPRQLAPSFCGRTFDAGLLADLPPEVDPCGERGEFHTFAWDAPCFSAPIPVEAAEPIERDGFVFAELHSL